MISPSVEDERSFAEGPAAGGQVGLVVDSILDVAEESIAVRSKAQRRGVLFNAVVQGRVTEFLDIDSILRWARADVDLQPSMSAAGE